MQTELWQGQPIGPAASQRDLHETLPPLNPSIQSGKNRELKKHIRKEATNHQLSVSRAARPNSYFSTGRLRPPKYIPPLGTSTKREKYTTTELTLLYSLLPSQEANAHQ